MQAKRPRDAGILADVDLCAVAAPDHREYRAAADAVRLSGLSRSEIYRRGAAGDLDIVKNGGRSLVIVASIKDYIARLPRAVLRAPKSAA